MSQADKASKVAKAASFEDFLAASSRLAERGAEREAASREGDASLSDTGAPFRDARRPKASSRKEKVGLTIDSAIVDAIDDYIYHERKQGRRLKKNDVYEAALRQFLGLEEGSAR